MTRIKRGNVARTRRKKLFKLAKGFRGAHSKLFRVAKQQVIKALRYSYRGRKNRKRDFRRLWITRINAASRTKGVTYSNLICNLKKINIGINRKMLAQISVLDTQTFEALVSQSLSMIEHKT
uniref:ribosomal protein L20 n=1 Tax=Tsunamia transpacifica TaxID=1935457 RepID=UPI001BEE6376|nr:ribosomal protein L20 [Tsunamia transpacifica]QUE27888.1 ribosomal protein L20 [Tsunamia transpacifica]UNJ14404.1 ribosomal protein L20 [Tsunamia transpacifica]